MPQPETKVKQVNGGWEWINSKQTLW